MKKIIHGIALFSACCSSYAGWVYSENVDKMTGKSTKAAYTESASSIDLPFPYAGKNHGNLQVRQHPSHGLDVMFFVDKGQILCSSYDGCTVAVRFDDKPAVKFAATTAADHDSKIIFLRNAPRFIESAKSAKTILIQVTMYQAGAPVFEFKTPASLEWGAKSSSKPKSK